MQQQKIEYHDGDTLLEGHLAYEETYGEKLAAVLVAPDWTGRNDFACQKANDLAELGYAGFALDMYGKDILGTDNDEKMNLIQPFMENRQSLIDRITKAYTTVCELDAVDNQRIAIIGYCFGGLCALDLARSGAILNGVVSFHGLLQAPEGIANKEIKAKVLALHGYDDPMVPPEQVHAFAKEMTAGKVDWQIHMYGNTKHAFTNPQANDLDLGTVYDKTAEERSWETMLDFLAETLK